MKFRLINQLMNDIFNITQQLLPMFNHPKIEMFIISTMPFKCSNTNDIDLNIDSFITIVFKKLNFKCQGNLN